jgi:hypothetical protein
MTQLSFLKINVEDSDSLIVSFSGFLLNLVTKTRYDFASFLDKNFSNINRYYYADKCSNLYHNGIHGISSNIDETVAYLKNEIKNYKNVTFIGTSAGGYAAILFGSLLNVNNVIAFSPPTFRRNTNIDEKYRDIAPYINETTKYYLFANLSITNPIDPHHVSHCLRISNRPNVYLTKMPFINLFNLRDNGKLLEIVSGVLNM